MEVKAFILGYQFDFIIVVGKLAVECLLFNIFCPHITTIFPLISNTKEPMVDHDIMSF